jgi:hypothetical protein
VRTSATIALLALGAAAFARGEGAKAASPPERLADTGLYADFDARVVSPDVLAFSPQYPLWTDGAAKERWIRLPPGTAIDASDPDAWRFPPGTRLWKEFSFGRRVETRMIERGRDGRWSFATYVWDEDERDARLAPERGLRGVIETSGGKRHDVPARQDCRACHEGGPSVVLGFSALQLSSDRDPLALHAESPRPGSVDLAELVERGLVRGLPDTLVATPPRIEARTPRERAALGYLHGNCGQCHNDRGPLASLGLALDVPLAGPRRGAPPAITSTLGRPSVYRGCRDASERIAPGDPEHSLLPRRMGSRNAILQMPPLGTNVADEEALRLLSDWIREDLAPAPFDASVAPTTLPLKGTP